MGILSEGGYYVGYCQRGDIMWDIVRGGILCGILSEGGYYVDIKKSFKNYFSAKGKSLALRSL